MGAACPCDAREMQQDQEEGHFDGKLVDLLERFNAACAMLAVFIVVIVFLGPGWQACGCDDAGQRSLTFLNGQGGHARKRSDREGEQKRHGHRPACRTVAQMALSATCQKITQIGEDTARPGDEIRKPGAAQADKAPKYAQRDSYREGIAREAVELLRLAFGDVGGGKGHHQHPVPNPDQRVPNPDRFRENRHYSSSRSWRSLSSASPWSSLLSR